MCISFCNAEPHEHTPAPPCPKSRTKWPFQHAKCASRSATLNHTSTHRPSAEAGDQLSDARTGDHVQMARSTSGLKIQINSVFGALLALNTESLDTATIYHRVGASSFRNWRKGDPINTSEPPTNGGSYSAPPASFSRRAASCSSEARVPESAGASEEEADSAAAESVE